MKKKTRITFRFFPDWKYNTIQLLDLDPGHLSKPSTHSRPSQMNSNIWGGYDYSKNYSSNMVSNTKWKHSRVNGSHWRDWRDRLKWNKLMDRQGQIFIRDLRRTKLFKAIWNFSHFKLVQWTKRLRKGIPIWTWVLWAMTPWKGIHCQLKRIQDSGMLPLHFDMLCCKMVLKRSAFTDHRYLRARRMALTRKGQSTLEFQSLALINVKQPCTLNQPRITKDLSTLKTLWILMVLEHHMNVNLLFRAIWFSFHSLRYILSNWKKSNSLSWWTAHSRSQCGDNWLQHGIATAVPNVQLECWLVEDDESLFQDWHICHDVFSGQLTNYKKKY